MTRFKDKVVIVTGAAGGIGSATCQRFASEQARLVVVVRNPEHGVKVAEAAKAAGAVDTLVQACDVSIEEQVAATCDAAMARWGQLDVVVNNAGVMTFDPIVDLTEDSWLKVLRVDLLGAAYFVKHAFKRMKPGGAVVNVASIHAHMTSPHAAPYAAAKAGTCSLSRTAAIEGKPLGIRVNTILPGAIDTPMLWDNPNVKSGAEKVDKSMVGSPENLAAGIAFLASDDAAFITGTELVVDGGRLAFL